MWVLLPLKHLSAAKRRLGRALDASERNALVHAMAGDLLQTLTGQPGVTRIILCSNDARIEALAAQWGAQFLPETELSGAQGMNEVVNAAASLLGARGAHDLLCLAGDVPVLSAAELQNFLQMHTAGRRPSVTLAPDRWSQGTNLLAWQPGSGFRAAFGAGSMARHRAQAATIGAAFSLCESRGAGLDIDEPEDLIALLDTPAPLAPRTRRFLHESGIALRLSPRPMPEAAHEAQL